MGKTWRYRYNRLSHKNQKTPDRVRFGSNGKPLVKSSSDYNIPFENAKKYGFLGETPENFEKWRQTSCINKKTYLTLQQASDAKCYYDSLFKITHHVYSCPFCGHYHLTKKKMTDIEGVKSNIVNDDFLPTPNKKIVERNCLKFPELLSKIMNESGVSKAELAVKCNVDNDTVDAWLSGDIFPFSYISRIAEVLNIEIEYLLS